jgi:uncharacterized protein DUF6148
MAGITLAIAEARLTLWLEADAAVARNQSYTIEERQLTRADAAEIRKNIDYWQAQIVRLQGGSTGGARVRYGVTN